MGKKTQFALWYAMLAVLAVLFIQHLWQQSGQVERIPYSQFRELLDAGLVEEVVISGDRILGNLTQPSAEGVSRFVTIRVDGDLADDLHRSGVKFSREVENTFVRDILSWTLPALIFVGIWYFLFRRIAGR